MTIPAAVPDGNHSCVKLIAKTIRTYSIKVFIYSMLNSHASPAAHIENYNRIGSNMAE